jgi:hypothetical protein
VRIHHQAASFAAAFAASLVSGTEPLGAVRPLLRRDNDAGDPAQFGTALNDRGNGEAQLAAVTVANDGHLDRVVTSPKRQIAPTGRIVDLDGALIIARNGCFGHASVVPLKLVV